MTPRDGGRGQPRKPISTPREHSAVRVKHAAEAAEDYCEAIADLLDASGEARVGELAKRFGLSHVTVSRVVARLKREGYVRAAPYQPIELTAKGKRVAEESRARHRLVLDFLLALGIDERTARLDAEGIEHHVSPATLAAIGRFVAGRRPSASLR